MTTWRRSRAPIWVITALVCVVAASGMTWLADGHRVVTAGGRLIPAAAPVSPQDVGKAHHREPAATKPAPTRVETHVIAVAAGPRLLARRLMTGLSVTGPTGWNALNQAIARIPGYVRGSMTWLVSTRYSAWGVADMSTRVIYISPNMPHSHLYDVAVHEWSHIRTVDPYHGDAPTAVAAMNRYYGGFGMAGAEDAADCMAILLGANWTHYTTCSNQTWQAGAARLIRGLRV